MANRKQRRKNKQLVEDEYTQSTKSIIITLVAVLVIFLVFYGITVLINNNNRKLNTKEPEEVETQIQYLEILGKSGQDFFLMFYKDNYCPQVFQDMHHFSYSDDYLRSAFPNSNIMPLDTYRIVSSKEFI